MAGVAFVLVALLPIAGQAQGSCPTVGNQTLTPNEVVHRRIEAGSTHYYELTLGQQQFAQINIEQRGIDLKLSATAPQFSSSVDHPNGFFGPETLSLLAPVATTYCIAVAVVGQYEPQDYEMRVDGPRQPTATDQDTVAAERVYAEAQILRSKGAFSQALEKYIQAFALWGKAGDLRHQGYSSTNIGRVQVRLRQFASAFQSFNQAARILGQAGDFSGQAFAFNEGGSAQRDFGDLREAVLLNQEALKLRIEIGDRYGTAQIYNNLGLTLSYMGHQSSALKQYEKALAIWRELQVHRHEIRALANAAKANAEMGDLEAARAQFQAVLEYCDIELNKKDSPLIDSAREFKPFALNGLGLVYDTWGDADSALNNYQQALGLFRESNRMAEAGDVLDNIALTYAFLGDAGRAIEYGREALKLRTDLKQPRSWGMTLSNLGYAYALRGEHFEAQKQLMLALQLNEGTRDRRFEAYTRVRLGTTYVANGEPGKALEQYQKALEIQQEPGFEDQRGQAITLDKIAEALALSGQEAEALKKHESAIDLWKFVGDGQGQALSLYGIARIERDRLNLANARDRVEEAIGIVENLRNKVTSRQLQMTYFAGKQDLYKLAIDIRMQLYDAKRSSVDVEAALAFSEKARARNLLDLLSESQADLYKDIPTQIADQIRRLDREISELTQQLVRFRGVGAKEDVADVQRKVDVRMNERDLLLSKRTSGHSREAQTLSAQEIQQLLDGDTLLLQYLLDEKRSHLWVVTRTRIDHYYLPDGAVIENTAGRLRQALKDFEPRRPRESEDAVNTRRSTARARYKQSAAELSRLILNDVATQLGKKRLVIVADGRLHYVPFEALPLPESALQNRTTTSSQTILLDNNEIVYQPSASALAILRRTRQRVASKKVAVFADPVFSNDNNNESRGKERAKLTRSLRDIGDDDNGDYALPRLEYSLKEANAIAAVAPRGSIKAVGFKANRALLTSPLLKQFGYIHFATHGLLNETNPELSGIVLSMVNERGEPEDGYLSLHDIYNLDLPTRLIVLSACETGIGLPVRGEGLIGLTRGFLNAGAQSVVVSLWRVEDEASAELMKSFYTHMFKKQMSPVAALRQAKLDMKDQYHPYQWAGFILHGDWK
jgi:CHAT domain-containing protein/Tfp pilus assembly protein PilF